MPITELLFSVDHPAAQGHFPGNPIIPGAVLLSEALRAIETSAGLGCSDWAIRSAKFFRPTRPGDRVRIEYTRSPDGSIRARCVVMNAAVLTCEIKCNAVPTA